MGRILFLAKYSLYYYYSFSNDFDNGIQHGLRTPNIDINQRNLKFWVNVAKYFMQLAHGLWTPNEGIDQRNLKFWADVVDKICFGHIYKFGIGI